MGEEQTEHAEGVETLTRKDHLKKLLEGEAGNPNIRAFGDEIQRLQLENELDGATKGTPEHTAIQAKQAALEVIMDREGLTKDAVAYDAARRKAGNFLGSYNAEPYQQAAKTENRALTAAEYRKVFVKTATDIRREVRGINLEKLAQGQPTTPSQ